ncbi:MAG: hypothetical protein US81_C0010G0010 [Parcubacteria group bacterium GW2011_GWE2_38_18]|nr:MAG: hypothetical protein US81_C0010G0010 [Parcubacteria group bacterium GW2011_GWE2_38_18]
MDINDKNFKKKWFEEEKRKIEIRKKRRYIHFDSRIKTIGKEIANEVQNPDYVVRRFFYPFLKLEKKERKFCYDENGKKYAKAKKPRLIQYASHKDAVIYSWYSYILSALYEKKIRKNKISENIIAYRKTKHKNNIDFAKEVFDYIKCQSECAAICFDIQGFFDNLKHDRIKMIWKNLLATEDLLTNKSLPKDHYNVFKSITKYSYCDYKKLCDKFNIKKKNFKDFLVICGLSDFKKILRGKIINHNINNFGIPQGTSLSVVLSNAYMIDFDIKISGFIKNIGGIYRRYSDDIIIVCDKKYCDKIKSLVKEEIDIIKLNMQEEKTEIRFFSKIDGKYFCIDEGGNKCKLQYLGIETDGNNELFRGKTNAKFYRRMSWAANTEKRRQKRNPKNKISKRKIYRKFLHYRPLSFFTYFNNAVSKLDSVLLSKAFQKNNLIKSIKKRINEK